MKNTVNGLNILICGSQNFDLDLFVVNVLDSFYNQLAQKESYIKQVYTSQYTGVCAYANQWVRQKNEQLSPDLQIKQKDFSMNLLTPQNGLSIYDELIIPEFILQNDPMFIQGKENIQKLNLQHIFVFPNLDGIIGAHSRNIMRFAQLAGLKNKDNIIDCSDILQSYFLKWSNKNPTKSEQEQAIESIKKEEKLTAGNEFILNLKNRHRNKTFR